MVTRKWCHCSWLPFSKIFFFFFFYFLPFFPDLTPVQRVAVEFNGSKRVLSPSLTSIEDLTASLHEALSITVPMTIEYLDPEFEEYMLLTKVDDLPKEKIKLKVVTQALSWWSMAFRRGTK